MVPKAILLLLGALCSLGPSEGSMECKNTIMNVMMQQCSGLGFKIKRSSQDVSPRAEGPPEGDPDLPPVPWPLVRPPSGPRETSSTRVKRQVSPETAEMMGRFAAPIVSQVIQDARRNRELSRYSRVAPVISYPAPVGYYGPFGLGQQQAMQPPSGVLPPASGDDLGFRDGIDLSPEEVEELYNDVLERLPRAARNKDESKKLFMTMAARCCQDVDVCLRDEKLSPCS
ncbi:uncharacterized protein LOC105699556 [Orussus abietinus]|uniref:uncharacterized protein LOC105699556 n=1 Tax=Orussus abietinus TaxID=222816 RepID=UPI000626A21E|nr:uncharacterized protein LOC105699556 [Orussus abietinus]